MDTRHKEGVDFTFTLAGGSAVADVCMSGHNNNMFCFGHIRLVDVLTEYLKPLNSSQPYDTVLENAQAKRFNQCQEQLLWSRRIRCTNVIRRCFTHTVCCVFNCRDVVSIVHCPSTGPVCEDNVLHLPLPFFLLPSWAPEPGSLTVPS